MKPIKTITDPEAFQLLADDTRRKILSLLRAKEMSACEIAEELDLTPQAVYHHIKRLLKAEMVEVTREERCDHLIESYYRATAEAFHCVVGKTPPSSEVAREQMVAVLNALKKLGFKVEFDDKKVTQIVDARRKLDRACYTGKYDDEVAKLNNMDFFTKKIVAEYAEILSTSNQEFAKRQQLERRFVDLLHSLTEK